MISKVKKDVYNHLKEHPRRLLHVNSVMLVALNLSIIHNVKLKDTFIAAMMHDYAKYATNEFNAKYIDIIDLNKYIDASVKYHAIAAANYAKKAYNINDDIYNAIYNHTFGRENMSKLEKIIFISDSVYLNGYNNTQKLYSAALNNLDEALVMASKLTIDELKLKQLKPHEEQIKTFEYYKEVI